jgi:hypothetical protein
LAISLHCSIASAASFKRSNPSLCKRSEIEVFSCETKENGKTIALCEAKLRGRHYLYYRFGTPEKLDFEYPKKSRSPAQSFKYFQQSWPKATTTAIAFANGGYRYSLFQTMSAYGYNGAGVVVTKAKKILSAEICKEHSIRTSSGAPNIWLHPWRVGIGNAKHAMAFIPPDGTRRSVCVNIHSEILKLPHNHVYRSMLCLN